MRNYVVRGFAGRGTVREQFLSPGRRGGFHLFLLLIALELSLPAARSQSNPIQLENQQPGTESWQIPWGSAGGDVVGEIKGYASASSVNKGGSINLHISVNPAQTYTIEVYRVGWYQGLGARLIQQIGPLNGTPQPAPTTDPVTGLIECHWASAYTLVTQPEWTSGVYLVLLKNAAGFQNYINFVVRDDGRVGALLYQQPVTTHQAYNDYPYDSATGKSLYAFNSYGANTVGGSKAAVKVSFDRPYAGDGDNHVWGRNVLGVEMAFIRWLERSGFDVTYSTDVDLHTDSSRLLSTRGLISPGHDEYWTKEMYDGAIAARDAGVNLGFFSANTLYTQVRLEPSTTGTPNRVLVCYREAALDPNPDPNLKTVNWREAPVNRPEQALVGVHVHEHRPGERPGHPRALRGDEQRTLGLRRDGFLGWRHGDGPGGLRSGSALQRVRPAGRRERHLHPAVAFALCGVQQSGHRELVHVSGTERCVGVWCGDDQLGIRPRCLQPRRQQPGRCAHPAHDDQHPRTVPQWLGHGLHSRHGAIHANHHAGLHDDL